MSFRPVLSFLALSVFCLCYRSNMIVLWWVCEPSYLFNHVWSLQSLNMAGFGVLGFFPYWCLVHVSQLLGIHILNLDVTWNCWIFNIKTQPHPLVFPSFLLKPLLLLDLLSNEMFPPYLSTQFWIYFLMFYTFDALDFMMHISSNILAIFNYLSCFLCQNYLAKIPGLN